jgi:predicted MPP superfamily phosphohydrolase
MFNTKDDCKDAAVALLGSRADTFNQQSIHSVKHFHANYKHEKRDVKYSSHIHTFGFSQLPYGETYTYYCYSSAEDESPEGPFQFYLPSPKPTSTVTNLIFFGDYDSTHNSKHTRELLRKLASSDTPPTAVIHMGDMAYDLESKGGKHGDEFMNTIQPVAATTPYMITPGNHETHKNFSNVNARFEMPLYEQTNNHYYSYNIENVHLISINFDLVLEHPHLLDPMVHWLKEDLIQANNTRETRPWIILYTHRPMYCSKLDELDCQINHKRFKKVDDLLYEYRVDLYLSGHIHTYERMLPIYNNEVMGYQSKADDPHYHHIINPEATVFVIQGKAGHYDNFEGDPYRTSKFSVKVIDKYSVLSVQVLSSTKLLIENLHSPSGKVQDHMYLIKDPNYDKTHKKKNLRTHK